MYKTTKDDLEQAVARVTNKSEVVARVVNQALDKYLVEAIEERTVSGKPSKAPTSVYLVTSSVDNSKYSRYIMITDKEAQAVLNYSGELVDIVDEPFADYVLDITLNSFLGVIPYINIYPNRA